MACTAFRGGDDNHLICGEFMFAYKLLDLDDSVKYCKKHNYELAEIKVKSGNVDEPELAKYSSQVSSFSIYRIGLKFQNENGTLVGRWSNGDKYDALSSGEIKLFGKSHENNSCYQVVMRIKRERLLKVRCSGSNYFVCRKAEKSVDINPSVSKIYPFETTSSPFTSLNYDMSDTSPNTKSAVVSVNTSNKPLTSESRNFYNSVASNTNQNTGSTVLIGVSSTFSIFFFCFIILLGYIWYSRRNQSKRKPRNLKNRNTPDSVDDVTSATINEQKGSKMEKAENKIKMNECNGNKRDARKVKHESSTIQLSICDTFYTTMVNETNNSTENDENADDIDDDYSFWIRVSE